eukprot:m.33748 g.33748  ORF g.33748 m.33748 type:complete len:270 (-) comp43249_c0_seq1:694-1503(-)
MSRRGSKEVLPTRAVDWSRQWKELDPDTKTIIGAIAGKLASSEMIQDRTYHFKTYPQCFIAEECVNWLIIRGYAKTPVEAMQLAELLQRGNFISHVVDDHEFKNEPLFFYVRRSIDPGPNVYQLVEDKNDCKAQGWLTPSGLFSKAKYHVLSATRKTLHVFPSDISSKPESTIFIPDGTIISYASRTAFTLEFPESSSQGSLTFEAGDGLESWIQGFVNFGSTIREDVSSLVQSAKSIFEFSAVDIGGHELSISAFSPKVCVVVNVASK